MYSDRYRLLTEGGARDSPELWRKNLIRATKFLPCLVSGKKDGKDHIKTRFDSIPTYRNILRERKRERECGGHASEQLGIILSLRKRGGERDIKYLTYNFRILLFPVATTRSRDLSTKEITAGSIFPRNIITAREESRIDLRVNTSRTISRNLHRSTLFFR